METPAAESLLIAKFMTSSSTIMGSQLDLSAVLAPLIQQLIQQVVAQLQKAVADLLPQLLLQLMPSALSGSLPVPPEPRQKCTKRGKVQAAATPTSSSPRQELAVPRQAQSGMDIVDVDLAPSYCAVLAQPKSKTRIVKRAGPSQVVASPTQAAKPTPKTKIVKRPGPSQVVPSTTQAQCHAPTVKLVALVDPTVVALRQEVGGDMSTWPRRLLHTRLAVMGCHGNYVMVVTEKPPHLQVVMDIPPVAADKLLTLSGSEEGLQYRPFFTATNAPNGGVVWLRGLDPGTTTQQVYSKVKGIQDFQGLVLGAQVGSFGVRCAAPVTPAWREAVHSAVGLHTKARRQWVRVVGPPPSFAEPEVHRAAAATVGLHRVTRCLWKYTRGKGGEVWDLEVEDPPMDFGPLEESAIGDRPRVTWTMLTRVMLPTAAPVRVPKGRRLPRLPLSTRMEGVDHTNAPPGEQAGAGVAAAVDLSKGDATAFRTDAEEDGEDKRPRSPSPEPL